MNNLKEKYMKKLKKTAGFTLVEMLIVVAIIAILIAISIPMVSKSLEKARTATDAANERSAKAAALITYMTDKDFDATTGNPATYYYDAAAGALGEKDKTPDKGYGQRGNNKNGYLKVDIDENGDVKLSWSTNAPLASDEVFGDPQGNKKP